MYQHLLESEIHANHRRAGLIADRQRVRSARRATLWSSLRHGLGLGLIALGERLAERERNRPAVSSPPRRVVFRAGS